MADRPRLLHESPPIVCRRCGASEAFEVVQEVVAVIPVDRYGDRTGGAEFGHDGRTVLRCIRCSHAWRTTRKDLDTYVDVR